MFERLLPLPWRRRRLLARLPEGPLREYYRVPFAERGREWREQGFVALDLETTGLDPRGDDILSVGLVGLRGARIELESARHRLVRPRGAIPEASAVIHQITDDRAAAGLPLREVLTELLARLAGRVLIAHHARVERGFLDAACRGVFGGPLLIPTVDTQLLAVRRLERGGRVYRGDELRLAALRERYNLPRYRAHDALSDALGAAELFVAQAEEWSGGRPLPLGRLLVNAL